MILIKDAELDKFPLKTLVDVIEHAMLSDEKNENIVPQRMHVTIDQNTFLLMPAYGKNLFGTKLVSVIPKNSSKQLPVINGLYSLSNTETGETVALMNASKLTAMRTGAIAAVAARALTPSDMDSIGIIGPGVQAVWIAASIAAIRPIKKIFIVGRSQHSILEFKRQVSFRLPEIEIIEVPDVYQLLSLTDTIVTATTSDSPVLPDEENRLKSKTFIAMGSYQKQTSELPDSVYRLSGQILIDAKAIRNEVGDILIPISKKIISAEDVITLGSVLDGKNHPRNSTKVFKSAGYALFDLFAAGQIYLEAKKNSFGTTFSF